MEKENKVFIEEWTNDDALKNRTSSVTIKKKRKRSVSSQANSKFSDSKTGKNENLQENSIIINDAYNLTEEDKRRCKLILDE